MLKRLWARPDVSGGGSGGRGSHEYSELFHTIEYTVNYLLMLPGAYQLSVPPRSLLFAKDFECVTFFPIKFKSRPLSANSRRGTIFVNVHVLIKILSCC
jgi:hypothetical protein